MGKQSILAHKTSFRNEWGKENDENLGKSKIEKCLRCGEKEAKVQIMMRKDKVAVQHFCEKLDQWMMKANMEPNIWIIIKQ